MNRKTVGIFVILVLVALVCVASYLLYPRFFEEEQIARHQVETSTAREVSITWRICGDLFEGYWYVRSPEMRRRASRNGMRIKFEDDRGRYAERLQKFADGKCDVLVLPVNSYLLHGKTHRYPGVIPAPISDSNGADALAVVADKFPNKKLSELVQEGLKVVYVRDSPTSFFIDATITAFEELYPLQADPSWRVEVDSIDDVAALAKAQQGIAFGLWESALSKVLTEVPTLEEFWNSSQMPGLIKDVFVFHRKFFENEERQAQVRRFFEVYYGTMNHYRENEKELIADFRNLTGLSEELAKAILSKIKWYDLHESASLQFGLPTSPGAPQVEGLVKTILFNTDVLMRTNKFTQDPLGGDAYLILDYTTTERLLEGAPKKVGGSSSFERDFPQLSAGEWSNLQEVGTLRIDPIEFPQGESSLNAGNKEQIDAFVDKLRHHYQDYRVGIHGHTGPSSDANQDMTLSVARAEAVYRRLVEVMGMDRDRFLIKGFGSTVRPKLKPGEVPRDLQYLWPRVEFKLYRDRSG